MDIIIKSFVGTFFIMVIAVLGMNINAQALQSCRADSFAADCVSRIESSDFAQSVIDACITEAEERGYELVVNIYTAGSTGLVSYGTLQLSYIYTVPLLGSTTTHTVTADLR